MADAPELDVYEAMSTLRAVRRLRPDPIPEDVLKRVLAAASWAPTGGNLQPWRIVMVTDAALKRGLGELYAGLWSKFAAGYQKRLEGLPPEEQAREQRTLAAGDYLGEHFHEAPAILIFCFNPALMAITDIKQERVSVVGGGSIYPAVQNLLLAARTEGLGCVLTTLLCSVEQQVRQLLHIPEEWGTAAAVPLGYPVGGGHGPIRRQPLEELVYRDRFGGAL